MTKLAEMLGEDLLIEMAKKTTGVMSDSCREQESVTKLVLERLDDIATPERQRQFYKCAMHAVSNSESHLLRHQGEILEKFLDTVQKLLGSTTSFKKDTLKDLWSAIVRDENLEKFQIRTRRSMRFSIDGLNSRTCLMCWDKLVELIQRSSGSPGAKALTELISGQENEIRIGLACMSIGWSIVNQFWKESAKSQPKSEFVKALTRLQDISCDIAIESQSAIKYVHDISVNPLDRMVVNSFEDLLNGFSSELKDLALSKLRSSVQVVCNYVCEYMKVDQWADPAIGLRLDENITPTNVSAERAFGRYGFFK